MTSELKNLKDLIFSNGHTYILLDILQLFID